MKKNTKLVSEFNSVQEEIGALIRSRAQRDRLLLCIKLNDCKTCMFVPCQFND